MLKILDKRINNGKVKYLIKWNEYSEDEKSWEPEENYFCDELLKEYEIYINSQNMRMEMVSCINGIGSMNATVPSTLKPLIILYSIYTNVISNYTHYELYSSIITFAANQVSS